MEKKYTASEVRDIAWSLDGLSRQMLRAYADLLEEREKAVPVMVVNHVSSAEHDLPIGMKLYAHPVPADADWKNNVLAGGMKAIVDDDGNVLYVNKAIFDQQAHKTEDALATVSALTTDAERLAEALRSIGENLSSVLCDPFDEVVVRGSGGDRQVLTQALKDLGELAAHSAQAQPPAASVTVDAVMKVIDGQQRLPYCSIDEKQAFRNKLEAALASQKNK